MREQWARGLALATALVVLLVSAAFAAILNPATEPAATTTAAATSPSKPTAEQVARGASVFDANHCARCHSVAGKGSPRSPLDGVGTRLRREELHDWVTGAESVQAELSPRAITAKQRYAELPDEQMQALLDYLGSL